MYTGLIAKRYATALIEYAASRKEEKRAYEEVQQLIGFYQEDLSLRDVLFSPVLPTEAKLSIVEQYFKKPVCESLDGFIRLVLRHHRERYLYFMLNSFTMLYKERHHILDATLTTAVPIGDEVVERICNIAQVESHSEVHMHREVRPELIGGFTFRIADVLIDASLASQIARLKREFGRKPKRIV